MRTSTRHGTLKRASTMTKHLGRTKRSTGDFYIRSVLIIRCDNREVDTPAEDPPAGFSWL
jgi:hypothetical protein